MNRLDLERLEDARNFARRAQDYARGLSATDLEASDRTRHALLYALVVLGETLYRVSTEVKSMAPDIPWRRIGNMRHRLVHAYWLVDLDVVANVIEHHIDPLLDELDTLIATLGRFRE